MYGSDSEEAVLGLRLLSDINAVAGLSTCMFVHSKIISADLTSMQHRGSQGRNDYKLCRCSPDCYKVLARRTRDRHYERTDPTQMLPSEDVVEFSAENEEPVTIDDPMVPLETHETHEEMLDMLDNDGAEYTSSDSVDDTTSDFITLDFNEEVEHLSTRDFAPTLEQIEAQLAAWIGPGQDEELHALSMYLSFAKFTTNLTQEIWSSPTRTGTTSGPSN